MRAPTQPNSWMMEIGRRPSRSPLLGGPQQSSFVVYEENEITLRPTLLPQGPSPIEDGEENPEAALLDDISIGQIGKDEQGNSFQLLRAEGAYKKPHRVLLRCLDNGEVFWVDTAAQHTVIAETVSYGKLLEKDLQAWLEREGGSGTAEDALWRMKDKGLWDWQVRYPTRGITLIGNWILHETPQSGPSNHWFIQKENLPRAQEIFEEWALDIETYPQIERYREELLRGNAPNPEDETDKLRRSVWSALLGARQIGFAADDLQKAARLQQSDDLQEELLSLSVDLMETRPLPKIGDNDFVITVAPLWRRIAAIRLEQNF